MQPSALVVGLHGVSRRFFQAIVSASNGEFFYGNECSLIIR